MIRISNLSKFYGNQMLFSDVNLTVHAREKVGLIGRNGTGKSTFFKMILGEDEYQNGTINISENYIIRSLEQNLNFSEDNILKQVCSSLPADSYSDEWKAESILMGLGFGKEDFEKSPSEFSSGFQVRIRLAEALVSECDLLLLDEPTNYLDISSLRWLSRFLKDWKESFMLITHDKHFMEEVVTHTVAIDSCKLKKIKGGPKKLIDQILLNQDVYEKTRQNQIKKKEKDEAFIRKFRSGTRSGLVQSRIKALEKQNIGDELEHPPEIRLNFKSKEFKANNLLSTKNITFGYTKEDLIINEFSIDINSGDKIGIIGKNGKGKSTLLNLLTGKLTKQSGTINPHQNLKVGYFGTESKEELIPKHTILQELGQMPDVNEQEIRNLCGSLLFTGDNVKKKISNLSGGEKSRICLAKVILFPSHLLALDEPTNHLDMESCEVLSKSLKNFPGTVVFVTHNEEILSEVANRLILFDDGKISVLEKTYDEFLKSDGWSNEEPIHKTHKKISNSKIGYLDKKDQKKQIRLVKKDIENLEKEIDNLEIEKIDITSKLNKSCISKDQNKIRDFGSKLKEINEKIDNKYIKMEEFIIKEEELN